MNIKNIEDTMVETKDGWLVSVRNKPYGDFVEVYFAHKSLNGIDIAHFNDRGQIVMSELKDGEEPEPTMKISNLLWGGMRQAINGIEETPDKKAVDAELIATKYHLEDMRNLLKLNKQSKTK